MHRTSISADTDTRDRLSALARTIGQPVSELLKTLSHADLEIVLKTTALRAAAESKGGAS